MKAMILAAGYGERLWPLTADRTKPALPVLGKPLVGYVADYLAKYGIEDVVVNLHHHPESVRNALGDGGQFGVRLQYVHEPVILGTSGALDNARELLEGDTFVVETAGFNDRTVLDTKGHPHSDALRVTERFRRRDFGHLDWEMTFDDPKLYTRAFTIKVPYELMADADIFEQFCENEKDSVHLPKQ